MMPEHAAVSGRRRGDPVAVVVVNVNPLYTPRELELQLKDSGARPSSNFAAVLAR